MRRLSDNDEVDHGQLDHDTPQHPAKKQYNDTKPAIGHDKPSHEIETESPEPFQFTQLPTELRLRIIRELLKDEMLPSIEYRTPGNICYCCNVPAEATPRVPELHQPLLLVSKSMHQEVMYQVDRLNTETLHSFCIHLNDTSLPPYLMPAHTVRRLHAYFDADIDPTLYSLLLDTSGSSGMRHAVSLLDQFPRREFVELEILGIDVPGVKDFPQIGLFLRVHSLSLEVHEFFFPEFTPERMLPQPDRLTIAAFASCCPDLRQIHVTGRTCTEGPLPLRANEFWLYNWIDPLAMNLRQKANHIPEMTIDRSFVKVSNRSPQKEALAMRMKYRKDQSGKWTKSWESFDGYWPVPRQGSGEAVWEID